MSAVNELAIQSPFPYFGGKSRVADEVWRRFGDVPNYVEPFAGSLAVLLQRPHKAKTETVNDFDCYLANFWRSLQSAPDDVARWADWPVNEADQHARHLWLVSRSTFRERMKTNPDYYDAKIAGWWLWGICLWIGSGWCDSGKYSTEEQYKSFLGGDAGNGIHRPSHQLPHLLSNKGINRQSSNDIYSYMDALSERTRRVRVCCGDWSRVLGESPTIKLGTTAVFLDPPYSHDVRCHSLYANDHDVAADVREWAIANGDNPQLRIALCGYDSEHVIPNSWSTYRWKAVGGYGSQGDGAGRENASKEVIWFSPHCISPSQWQQLDMLEAA